MVRNVSVFWGFQLFPYETKREQHKKSEGEAKNECEDEEESESESQSARTFEILNENAIVYVW